MTKKNKEKKNEVKKDDDTLYSGNVCLADNNKISESRVLEQLAKAPDPDKPGKSGYPHEFKDMGKIIPRRENTVSTSYYEYPITQTEPGYAFDSKPKADPGPYRGIVNQKKDYRATICHDGEIKDGKTYPNRGFFHLCKKLGEKLVCH